MNHWNPRIGARPLSDGSVRFVVWAPLAQEISVVLSDNTHRMQPQENGYFSLTVPNLRIGSDYLFLIDENKKRADPASRWQPNGVHGASRIYDPNGFNWTDEAWERRKLKEYMIYELHVGTFTSAGTFEGVIEKIPYLKSLGMTAIELMPVAQFPGTRNWGYDGVFPYAVQESYGGPDGLKRLVNACHQANLAVILDVVYNHLGPEGNYLPDFGPYFTDRYQTPWGKAINFDGANSDPVRRFFIDNALFWQNEYHIDALRLDAVHAIFDFSAKHFLLQLSEEVHTSCEKPALLIAESDLNDVRVINPKSLGGYQLDAQWNDDFHHALHAYLTKRTNSYFADFGTLKDIAKAIEDGFVNNGRYSSFRKRKHGNSSAKRPAEQFVICMQNHDQIANACRGQRIGSILTEQQQKLAAALLFFSPNLPMLFMGQEWSETCPFSYFTSHGDQQLIEAVRKGYRKECSSYDFAFQMVDPQDKATFDACKLDWNKLNQTFYKEIFTYYQELIRLRKTLPSLSNCRKDLCRVVYDENAQWLLLQRGDESGQTSLLVCNFSEIHRTIPVTFPKGQWRLVFDTGAHVKKTSSISQTDEVARPPFSACLYVDEVGDSASFV